MDYYAYAAEEEEEDSKYALHNAVEVGDIERLASLLQKPEPEPPVPVDGLDVQFILPHTMRDDGPNVNAKDDDLCTPLHVAILNAKLDALKILLEAGARVHSKCDGCPPLHMAVCVGAHPEHAAFALEAVQLLIDHGAVVMDRDDGGRTPLHWAAISGLVEISEVLLNAGVQFSSQQMLGQPDDGEGGTQPMPSLTEFQDKQGNTALHLAARYCQPAIVDLLLSQDNGQPASVAIKQKNKQGYNVLHMAAVGGNPDCIKSIVTAYPASMTSTTRQGLTPVQIAAKRAHLQAVAILEGSDSAPAPTHPTAGHHKPQHTLILAPPECLSHHTAPWPITRGDPPPPENVNRIIVLTQPGTGILRTRDFANCLRWDERPRRAAMGDILRVHDWAYVHKIQSVCQTIPDDPSEVGQLDADTAISHRTFSAALAAAGAVTHAVDEVVSGRARNAFCAVRPPGHHAGPAGVVTSARDPRGSHGFCLFNNVAIGAAYAMTVHRHAGIKRVALLDFDVHHGNGTEACVANTAPSVAKYSFKTPFGEGVQKFPVYAPWHDVDDKDNIFFASVQGYGPKSPTYMEAFVYPGSGATCDTRNLGTLTSQDVEELFDDGGDGEGVGAASLKREDETNLTNNTLVTNTTTAKNQNKNNTNEDAIEEDPDHEFVYSGGEMPRTEGPRIIDVGIPGPGSRVALWRRSWRDKILPALVKFDPDIIFVSAGFDAHKKDDINFSYIGVHEKDYEWLTDQIVQVANRCCAGRVVSVLEGGYKIQGKVCSAFARSVAAHVKAMAEPNGQIWDPRDAKWEREHEKQVKAEAEAKKAAQAAAAAATREALAAQARLAAADVEQGNGDQHRDDNGDGVGMEGTEAGVGLLVDHGDGGSPLPVAIASPDLHVDHTLLPGVDVDNGGLETEINNNNNDDEEEEGGEGGGRRKRRRSNVDYVALNKKIEEESKANMNRKP